MSMPLWKRNVPGPCRPSVSIVFRKRVRGSPKFARIGCCLLNGLIGQGNADAPALATSARAKQAMSKMSRTRTSRKDGEARSRLAGSLDGGLITSLRPQHRAGEAEREPAAVVALGLAFGVVGLARERGEPCLQEIVDACAGERPGQHAPEARRQDLRGREPGGGPRADAAAAGYELADRLLHVAGLNGTLLVGLPRVPFDERFADEARDVIPRDCARGLERRHRKRRQIEPGLVARVAVEQARNASGHREPAREDSHDPGVRFVGRAYLGSLRSGAHGSYPWPKWPSSKQTPPIDRPATSRRRSRPSPKASRRGTACRRSSGRRAPERPRRWPGRSRRSAGRRSSSRTTSPLPRSSVTSSASSSRTTRSSTSSPTTTTTSRRRTCLRPTSTSRRTPRRTTTSHGSGSRPRPRSSPAVTWWSSPRSPPSTGSARPRSGAIG